jgi:hypothetical protein
MALILTQREVASLTGIPHDKAAQVRWLTLRGIRNFGINEAGRVVVPRAAIESVGHLAPQWSPDFGKVLT